MRPPTKQASRFRSTAKTNRPSLTNWDLVWPLVFKLLCHVSSNWYLMFSLLPSNLDFFIAPLHSVFVPKSLPASAHCLCVSEPGAKSDCWFTLGGKCAVTVRCYMYKHPVFLDIWNRGLIAVFEEGVSIILHYITTLWMIFFVTEIVAKMVYWLQRLAQIRRL